MRANPNIATHPTGAGGGPMAVYGMCNSIDGTPFHGSNPYELPGGAQVYYTSPSSINESLQHASSGYSLSDPSRAVDNTRHPSPSSNNANSQSSLPTPQHGGGNISPPSNPLVETNGLCYANLDTSACNGYYPPQLTAHGYHSASRDMPDYDITSAAAAGYAVQHQGYPGYLDTAQFTRAAHMGYHLHHPASDPLRDSPTGLCGTNNSATGGQHIQSQQNSNIPTYKWMHIKRNVPKPDAYHVSLDFRHDVLSWRCLSMNLSRQKVIGSSLYPNPPQQVQLYNTKSRQGQVTLATLANVCSYLLGNPSSCQLVSRLRDSDVRQISIVTFSYRRQGFFSPHHVVDGGGDTNDYGGR
ncbi:unnamed protein product [Cyprideis torosa]|uniref:Uncharacterized protein n=1 Tax=Cyprideis torosa TaxID=163714 RepID=A0A7R8W769_9CRUS|nr:unnamed protein product [Cyprideis torosa]CAG0885977.1 unnamed protein product [Cyprideis torosa]